MSDKRKDFFIISRLSPEWTNSEQTKWTQLIDIHID